MRIDLGPAEVARCIDEIGFGFMFAPRHHAAMKHVVPVRKELAVRTIFNFLGPLTNPAGATRQLLGVSDRRYQETIAEALVGLGCERALVVCAADGVDEISVSAETRVVEVKEGRTEEWFVRPEELGVERAEIERIAGGEPGGERGNGRRACWRARAVRRGTSWCSTPEPRSWSAEEPTTSRRGSSGPARRSTRAQPGRCSPGWSS